MIVALSLLAFTSAVASAAGSADQCCKQRVKDLSMCIKLLLSFQPIAEAFDILNFIV